MSKKMAETSNITSIDLVAEEFVHEKELEKKHKGNANELRESILHLKDMHDLDEIDTDKVTVKISETTRTRYDDDKLIEIIKELGIPGVVETKEVVNKSNLDAAIKSGEIEMHEIMDAVKTTTSNRVTYKVKEAE